MATPKHSIENFKLPKEKQTAGTANFDCSGHVTLGNSAWVESKLLPGMTATIESIVTNTTGPYGGTYVPSGGMVPAQTPVTPTIGITPGTTGTGFGGSFQTFPSVPYPAAEEETDECADGHYVDQKTIRTVIEDGEDQITGRCLFCNALVYLPELEGALAFERAGKAVGRAMTLGDGDGENVGALLAEVNKIERDLKGEMVKFQRALGMLDIARDLVEQRACA